MKLLAVLMFLLSVSTLFSQDTCSNYQPDCQYCAWPSTAYHDNGEIAFQRHQFFGVKKSRHWNCQGKLTKKVTTYRRFEHKKGKSKHWQATYHPNGQVKEIKKFVLVDCLHFRRTRIKRYDENGKRIRE